MNSEVTIFAQPWPLPKALEQAEALALEHFPSYKSYPYLPDGRRAQRFMLGVIDVLTLGKACPPEYQELSPDKLISCAVEYGIGLVALMENLSPEESS